ncbi:uncharacterized protein LOC119553426 isoform X2 [Drosophila subpulchrella]|uniref:uncharacterized protein LOC119553426 isoform X2 n=1 Tax=Drosophila subpulchrella TaxID=1486046 RepID=UPI0018A14CB6|nr:uncharacterized protein LOC119553426 isoform X2 [Drosophila subpulchrella]
MRLSTIVLCCLIYSLKASGMPKNNCPSERICGEVSESKAVCVLDENKNCIRKFKSSCHLAIAACKDRYLQFTDYSDEYCGMDGWMCQEPPYERWTLFFGQEDER